MLYIGSNLDSQDIGKQRELRHIKIPKKLPHTKAILIDQKALFWGTGNFTTNGIDSLREIFLLTSDLAVIRAFENYYTEINNSPKDNRPISAAGWRVDAHG